MGVGSGVAGENKKVRRGRKGRDARRSAGRNARRSAGRGSGGASGGSCILRGLPHYDLLDEAGLERIEWHADTILSEFGIEIRGDPEALELFRGAGAEVAGERLRFERGLVRDIVRRSAPSEFVIEIRGDPEALYFAGVAAL